MKFNIAFVPNKISRDVIALAQRFQTIAHTYCLGQNSIPHVTLLRFIADEHQIDELWNHSLQLLKPHRIQLSFPTISCMDSTKHAWISLLPDQRDTLTDMHQSLLSFIKHPLLKAAGYYDPHMTLCNTQALDYRDITAELLQDYATLSDEFTLILGKSDDAGQLTEILHQSWDAAAGRNK